MKTEHNDQAVDGIVEHDGAAVSAALSVHYIVLVLYTLPALASVSMLLMLSVTNNDVDNTVWWLVSLITLTFVLLHLLAVKGLRNRKKWGYSLSVVLSLILLLLFPFGTVLGAILISQLIKFRFKHEGVDAS